MRCFITGGDAGRLLPLLSATPQAAHGGQAEPERAAIRCPNGDRRIDEGAFVPIGGIEQWVRVSLPLDGRAQLPHQVGRRTAWFAFWLAVVGTVLNANSGSLR